MQITKSKLYKHYSFVQKIKHIIPLFSQNDEGEEINIFDFKTGEYFVENQTIKNDLLDKIWRIVKSKSKKRKRFFIFSIWEIWLFQKSQKSFLVANQTLKISCIAQSMKSEPFIKKVVTQMNEKDLFKKAIEENLSIKEGIWRRVLNTVEIKNRKGAFFMKKKSVVSIIAITILATVSMSVYAAVDIYEYNQADSFLGEIGIEASSLSRSDAKKVYKDIKSDAFEYETTKNVLYNEATKMGINNIPQNAKAIYDSIVKYNGLVYTEKITSAQIKAIKAGTSYKDIIKVLGNTKDIGSGRHVLQYAVDGDKIFYLSFGDENDICNRSGDELIKTLVDAKQDSKDENTFTATLTQRSENSILVSCPTFKNFDVISLSITKDTVIQFENGERATLDDITGSSKLVITITGQIAESYPPQGVATKIIIKRE